MGYGGICVMGLWSWLFLNKCAYSVFTVHHSQNSVAHKLWMSNWLPLIALNTNVSYRISWLHFAHTMCGEHNMSQWTVLTSTVNIISWFFYSTCLVMFIHSNWWMFTVRIFVVTVKAILLCTIFSRSKSTYSICDVWSIQRNGFFKAHMRFL